jgi:uncharacterized protein YbaR (Trm112 family)
VVRAAAPNLICSRQPPERRKTGRLAPPKPHAEDLMPISEDLLQILCCPKTKVPVQMLDAERLAKLNAAIGKGALKNQDGSVVEKPLEEGLVTEDGKTVYRIDEGIPVMLIDQGIPTSQLEGW